MADDSRTVLLKQREVAALKYKYHNRKDPDPDAELGRDATKRRGQRSWRRANQVFPDDVLYYTPWIRCIVPV